MKTSPALEFDGTYVHSKDGKRFLAVVGDEAKSLGPLFAASLDLLDANKLTIRNLESMLLQLPKNSDQHERASLQKWADIVRTAIAKATQP